MLLGTGVFAGLFVLLAAGVALAERLLLGTRPRRITVNGGARRLECPPGASLLEALTDAGLLLPASCGGRGICGLCKVKVCSGAGGATAAERPLLSAEEQAEGYRLACILRPAGDIAVDLPEETLAARLYTAEVAHTRAVTHDVREVSLRLLEPRGLRFRPGQYVQVLCPSLDGPVFRAYSIASPPGEGDRIDLVVKRVPGGAGSSYLHWLRPGHRVHLAGPYGGFRLSEDPGVGLVLVAGGCGVAPVLGIARYVAPRWPGRRVWVFIGVRSGGDIAFREELLALGRGAPGLTVHYVLSEPRRGDRWAGPTGMVHEAVERLLPSLAPGVEAQAYLCGPRPMIEATRRVLLAKGVRDVWADTL